MNTVPDFLKHLFTKHDGEARLLGETSWTSLLGDVRHPWLWAYQFATTQETRRWLANRQDPNEWLTIEQVHWVLDAGDGRTLLIRRERAASGASRFLFRCGNVVTLPQMMYWGFPLCTCYDVYKFYVDLPIIIHKRCHPGQKKTSRKRPRNR